MSSETEEVSVASAVDPAAAADLIIDESCAAAAALAVAASFNAGAQGNNIEKDTKTSEQTDAAIDISEQVNDLKISPVNGIIDNNVEENSEACAAGDEVKQKRSVSGSPLPASTSGSLVPATGKHLLLLD